MSLKVLCCRVLPDTPEKGTHIHYSVPAHESSPDRLMLRCVNFRQYRAFLLMEFARLSAADTTTRGNEDQWYAAPQEQRRDCSR
jgi:hypothetical protein